MSVHVLKRTTNPSTAPAQVGSHWINETTGRHWLAKGTASVADWVEFTADTDTGITQLTGDVTAGPGNGSQAATIANGAVTNAKVASGIDAVKIGAGSVDNTEFGYLNGVTSAIQTQLDAKVDENAAIVGATKTKITYDAKGLVTAGADAAIADITGLSTALAGLVPYVGANADIDLGNTQRVSNCQDPTNPQDVATKNYVDTNVLSSADTEVIFNDGGVLKGNSVFTFNKTNGTLKIPTLTDAFNNDVLKVDGRQILRPDGGIVLDWSANGLPTWKSNGGVGGFSFEGGTTPYFQYDSAIDTITVGNANRFIFSSIPYVQIQLLEDVSTYTVLDTSNRYLYDNVGTKAIEFSTLSRQLFDFGGSYPSVDYGNYQLYNIGITNSVPLLDWSTSAGGSVKIYDGYANQVVGDFTNKQLLDASGATMLDWANRYLYDNYNLVSLDWNFHNLLFMGNPTLNWELMQLYDSTSVTSVFWQSRTLNDNLGNVSVDWQSAVLRYDNVNALDWASRILYNAGGTNIFDWAGNSVRIKGAAQSNDGATWTDTTQKALRSYQNGATQTLQSVIATQTATGTCANTVTETQINSTVNGTLTLPSSFFVAGKTIRVKGAGFHSSTGSPTLNLRVKLGSTTVCATGAHTHHNATNAYFEFEVMITCRTTGASGTVFGQGSFFDTADVVPMGNTATTTINTTTTQAITVTAQWSAASASNTISMTNMTVEVLN